MMRLFLACILTLFPLTAWAEPVQPDKTDVVDSPVAVDPDSPSDTEPTGDQLDESEQLWPYGNPYSPASATNFEQFITPSSYGHNRFRRNTYEPEWLNAPFVRYGSPSSPDPMRQRYDVDALHSLSSPMNLYTRGGRIERR
jgi:hypothetical protein